MSFIQKVTSNKVFKNFSYVTIGSILAQVLNLVAIIKIAKILAPESYGTYTFLTVQGLLVFTIAELGIRNIVIRSIARDKFTTKSLVYNGILLRLLSVFIFSILYFIYNKIFGSLNVQFVFLIFVFSFSWCITNLLESTFWGHQKMLAPAVINVLTSSLWLLVVLFLIKYKVSIAVLFFLFIVINNFLTGILYFIILKANNIIVGNRESFKESSLRLLKQSWPYFVLVLLNLPYNYLTNNFLDINSTKTQIGYFNLVQKLMSPVSLVITFSLSALFPNLSSLWVKDQERFKNSISTGVRLFFLVALTICFIYTSFAEYIIKLLFSQKYFAIIEISKIQIWFVFLMGVNSFIGTIWGATNNERMLVKSSIINVIIALPVLYYSSRFGALGLSYGYVISFAVFEIYLWTDFKKSINIKINNDLFLWLLVVLLFIISFFVIKNLNIFIRVAMSSVIIVLNALFLLKKSKSKPVLNNLSSVGL